MRNFSKLIGRILIVILLDSCANSNHQPILKKTNLLLGSWNMEQVHWKTKDTTYSIFKTQPGMFMFSEKKYSIMWVPIDTTRIAFKNLSRPTEKEIISGFRSVVFNAGSYTYTDSTVTATAEIAKVPGFENGKQFYRYRIKNDTLSITMFDETYPNGKKPNWFGRYVTEFVLIKTK